MIFTIALIGRPNVGKSTLFNRLTRSQHALVWDLPGVTRDRQIGQGEWEDKPYIVIDTAGIHSQSENEIETAAILQTEQAMVDADVLFLIMDARLGLTPMDTQIVQRCRLLQKPLFLVVNKVDGQNPEVALCDFYQLGLKETYPIAATQNWGIAQLMSHALTHMKVEQQLSLNEEEGNDKNTPKVAVIGRPNVGKSTLVNRMLGEDRVIVCDHPGTTRDSIYISMERMGHTYTLIDTAGVRKKKNVTEVIEKFSVIKTLQAIKDADVILLTFDARLGLSDQDLSLLSFAIDAGSSIIICANKWDGMSSEDRLEVKKQLKFRLRFAEFVPIHFISALHGTGVGELFSLINKVYTSASVEHSTTQITEILERAVALHPPPLVQGRRIKLRYAHCGGNHPLTIVIHGNQTEELPQSYSRYLAKFYMKALKTIGTPIRIVCKTGDNPYKDKKNILTKRQLYKRQRLMKHVKRQAKKRQRV